MIGIDSTVPYRIERKVIQRDLELTNKGAENARFLLVFIDEILETECFALTGHFYYGVFNHL